MTARGGTPAQQGLDAARLPRISGWGHRNAGLRLKDKIERSQGQPYVFPHLRQTLEDTWRRAGVAGVADMDGVETHDCFSTTEYMAIDHLGLTPPGQSWRAVEDGTIERGGACPVNMSGGLIGCGHPVGATGARMLHDAARQVSGRAGEMQIEGARRMRAAEYGFANLLNTADTVIVIPNDKLLDICPRLGINAAFKVADEVLMRSIKGITELITKPGLVNLDFNDVKTIMKGAGVAMIGLGESGNDTDDRAADAINDALNSPLLDVDVSGATGVLVNVVGGADMTISEAEKVAEIIRSRVSPNARIIWGAAVDPALQHKIRVMVVITGVSSKQILGRQRGSARLEDSEVDVIR